MQKEKICVVYHYCEVDETYKENFLHFLVFGYLPDVDFFIVISGNHSIELPELPNAKYIFIDNKNHDFGGYSFALTSIPITSYDFFVFVNSSVRGPYLPGYLDKDWVSFFAEPLKDDVGLFGATINILSGETPVSAEFKRRHGGAGPFSHVQSMAFALNQKMLKFLLEENFFSTRGSLEKLHLVTDYEILLSQKIIRAGWNIKCLLPEYNTVDYRLEHEEVNPTSVRGDPFFEGAYFGRTPHPFETIFSKTNRNLFPAHFFDKITYSMILRGPRLPRNLFNPMVEQYVQKKMSPRGGPMPSIQDQVAHYKLTEILTSFNEILAFPTSPPSLLKCFLPSPQGQIAQKKLAEIISAVNEILERPVTN